MIQEGFVLYMFVRDFSVEYLKVVVIDEGYCGALKMSLTVVSERFLGLGSMVAIFSLFGIYI
jgi:hypothetical protein